MIIGLDIGISSTKAVAFVAKKLNKAAIWESGFSEKLLQEFISSLSSIDSKVEKMDIALGLINLTLQNIGVMAYLAGSGRGIKTFVVIGRMTTLQSTHMTAIGAAIKAGR